MKPFLFAFSFVLCATMFSAFTPAAQNYTTDNNAAQAQNNNDIEWVELDALDSLMQKEPRKVLFKIYADWCGWCKKMDKTTFKHEAVVQYVGEKFYAVRLDAEDKNTLNFKGKTYKYVKQGKAGANELALELIKNRVELPATVILDEKYRHLSLFPGYLDAHDLDLILHYYTTSAYQKRVPIGIFAQNYKSTIKRSDLSQF